MANGANSQYDCNIAMSFGVFQSIILGCVVMFFVPFKLQVNIILSLNLLSSVFFNVNIFDPAPANTATIVTVTIPYFQASIFF